MSMRVLARPPAAVLGGRERGAVAYGRHESRGWMPGDQGIALGKKEKVAGLNHVRQVPQPGERLPPAGRQA
ncbi:hypothetical protein GCM10025795_14860 [Verticiella sediminum]